MMRAVAFITAMMGATAAPAADCYTYTSFLFKMKAEGKQVVFQGMTHENEVFEVWAKRLMGDWVIVRVPGNGIGCIVTEGVAAFLRMPGEGL